MLREHLVARLCHKFDFWNSLAHHLADEKMRSRPPGISKKGPEKYQYHDLHYAPFKKDASSARLTRVLVLVHGGGTLRALLNFV